MFIATSKRVDSAVDRWGSTIRLVRAFPPSSGPTGRICIRHNRVGISLRAVAITYLFRSRRKSGSSVCVAPGVRFKPRGARDLEAGVCPKGARQADFDGAITHTICSR